MRFLLLPSIAALWIATWPAASAAQGPAPGGKTPSASQRAAKEALAFSVQARFVSERRGDGSPTVHYRYLLSNNTHQPIHLSTYWRPFRIRRLEPRAVFRIERGPRRPHKMRLPRRSDLLTIGPRSTKTVTDWQWSSSFEVDDPDSRLSTSYRLKKPSRIAIHVCFHGGAYADLRAFLPAGATLWTGSICAKPVFVAVTALPTLP